MANPTLLDMPIARDGNKNAIPTTDNGTTGLLSQQYGWQLINAIPPQQGGKAVKREDFNGALYLLSNLLFYLQKGWQFEWNSRQAYYAGCIVKDTSDGKMYQCLNDITSTTAPHSDTTNWKLWDLSMLANYLPLSGGHLTGDYVTIDLNNSNGAILFMAGLHNSFEGANLQLNGPNRSTNPGYFNLIAQDGNASKILRGTPDGTLTWNGHNVLTDANGGYLPLSGGTMTGDSIGRAVNNDLMYLSGGQDTAKGAYIQLNGSQRSGNGGAFYIVANAENSIKYNALIGKATGIYEGELLWGNNDLGGSAIVAKSLGTTGYSKRADGLIEQWGQTTAPATVSDNVPVTFPITFPNAVSSVVITSEGNLTEGNSPMSYTQVIDVTNSGFKYRSFYNSPGEIKKYWRAIGY